MTAAHKTLPIPTWVEVTNLRNNRRVIVKVNDRGPFVDNRVIDLSYSAARALDMIRDGTARVQVRALGTALPAPAPPAPILAANDPVTPVSVPAASPSRGFSVISEARADTVESGDVPSSNLYVQVGAFGDYDNAAGLVTRLRQKGFPNSFVVSLPASGRLLHRVRIGPLSGADQFDRIRRDLRAIGVGDARLITGN
jgi:peptidoglycan lytic transglycosylase